MNDFFNNQDLETLLSHQGKPAVSIYLPTTRIPTRVQAESLQFKNLVRDAEEELAKFDLRGPEVREMLEPARALIGNTEFWRHQKDGLAVYMTPDLFLTYQLPISFNAGLYVGEYFHFKPLMSMLSTDPKFYILAVSQNQVRFFECTRFSVQEIDPEAVPTSLQEILAEYDFERQLQFHTSTETPAGNRRDAIFHGVGGSVNDDDKLRLREFFDRIDKGLQEYLRNDQSPLVFAGVDYLFPIYQDANTYAHLVESNIEGNPDELSGEQLHQRAWNIIQRTVDATEAADIERYFTLAAQEDMTSVDLEEIVPWADQGRVDTIFVDKDAAVWGTYDPEKFKVKVQGQQNLHNRDLTDLAALLTLLRKGNVYLLTPEEMEMEFGPENRHLNGDGSGAGHDVKQRPAVAAIYRFAISENPMNGNQ